MQNPQNIDILTLVDTQKEALDTHFGYPQWVSTATTRGTIMAKETFNSVGFTWLADPKREAGGRWRKVYKRSSGVPPFYFADIQSQTDKAGQQRCLEAFQAWRDAVDEKLKNKAKPHQEQYQQAMQLRKTMLEFMALEEIDEPDTKANLNNQLQKLELEFAKAKPRELKEIGIAVDPVTNETVGSYANCIVWLDRLDSLRFFKKQQNKQETKTISLIQHIEEILEKEKTRARAGQIKLKTYKTTRDRVMHFQKWLSQNGHVEINARVCDLYHDHLVSKIASEEMTDQGGANLLLAMKKVVTALWRIEVCDIPRNLSALTIAVETKEVTPFTAAELKAVWKHATERTELYALLMLNCGMLPTDIASLKHSEYSNGVITRRRTKTGKQLTTGKGKNVPMVSWHLWNRTRELLERFATKEGELMLLNDEGRPLLRQTLKENGDVAFIDNIDSAWARLRKDCTEAGTPIPPMEKLRKTGACKLEESGKLNYGRYAQFFLGQAPQSMTEKRYAKPDPVEFAKVCQWLGKQFGFDK
ncbi:MAG: hypothetical protein U0929_09660 [Planctomycetaceae bacterium]